MGFEDGKNAVTEENTAMLDAEHTQKIFKIRIVLDS
jgi:hypothetical protein